MTVYVSDDYFDYKEHPLNHARIGWDSGHRDATWSASSSQTDYEPDALNSEMTLRRWRADSDSATITGSNSESIDYVGVAAHNLEGADVTLTVGGTQIESTTIDRGETLLFLFAEQSGDVELDIDHDKPPEIGVIYFGKVLEMQRPFFSGHSPVKLNSKVTPYPRKSQSGQFLSRSIIRRGYEGSVEWDNLGGDWVRDHFMPFVEHAREVGPFFFAWNIRDYPRDVVYAWSDDTISPSYNGTRDWMQVGFEMKAFRERE